MFCLSELVILVLHETTRKLTYHLKQALYKFRIYQICKLSPFDKNKLGILNFVNLQFITIVDNFFAKSVRPISTLFLPFLD